jgi:hypothetical protein
VDRFVGIPTECAYLKGIYSNVIAVASNREEIWWREADGRCDSSAKADIAMATQELIRGGLTRPQAKGLANTLRYLDVGVDAETFNKILGVDAGTFNKTPVHTFALGLRTVHAAVEKRVRESKKTSVAPGPFEIVAHLTEPLVSEGIEELEIAAISLSARWLSAWGYSTDVRNSVLTLTGFRSRFTLRERAESLARLYAPVAPSPDRAPDAVAEPQADPAIVRGSNAPKCGSTVKGCANAPRRGVSDGKRSKAMQNPAKG